VKYRPLGRTGLTVSALSLGTVSLGIDYGIAAPGAVARPPEDEAIALIRAAVDRGITLADLFGTIEVFVKRLFDDESVRTRFRSDYFPYTEPSAELAVSCIFCHGEGCRVCSFTGWIELGGCGMVDPNVFEAVGYDPEQWQGFAFGFGLERIAMIRYGIDEIRTFFEGDVRFLAQY